MESAIVAILEKVLSLCENEVNFLSDLRDEVDLLESKLKLMRAFLDDKRKESEHSLSEQTKVEIEQTRDVVFDGESVVQEFHYRFPPRPRGEHGRLYRLCWTLTPAVTTICARHRIRDELRKVRDRADGLNTKKWRPKVDLGSSVDDPRNYRLADEARLVGVDVPKRELLSLLIDDGSDPTRSAVALLGMGGSGKTTLADLVYNDTKVKQHFEHRAWVTVSQSFKRDELLLEVVKQLSKSITDLPHPSGGHYELGPNVFRQTLLTFLRGRRYLIVLDDLWREASWDEIESAFPHNNCGSRLLLTTRRDNVASYCVQSRQTHIYHSMPLSVDESWTLFCQKAFPQSRCPQGCPQALESTCRQIVQRCEGLPLAIAAIGGMLATKDNSRINEFERVSRDLGGELQENDRLKSIKKVLSLSFNDLPRNIRFCLLYLAIFPEDDIVKNSLVRLWMAESFVPEDNEVRKSTLEERGEDYFNDLFNRSLIQVSKKHDDGRIKACRIHDLIREIILHEANEEYFTMIANEEERKVFPKRVQRLSVQKTVENIHAKEVNFFKLRSLLFFQVEEFVSSFSISEFLKDTRLLQVLDCSHTQITIFPKEITKLYNLKYLSLRGTKVNSIPHSVVKLRNLQTLNLKDTGIEALPVKILQLSSLRHIHAYRYVQHGSSEVFTEIKGFKALKGINALTSLQSLCHMEATEGGGDILKSIGNLKQLRRLGISRLKRQDGVDLCLAINKLSHLVTLVLQSRDADEILSLQSLTSIPPCLQRLYIAGRLDGLPHWIPLLLGLTSLVLRFSGLRNDQFENLKKLSNLVELRLHKAYEGEALCFSDRCFPILRILDLRNLGQLRSVAVEGDAIPCLETLIFEDCKLLKEMPSGIESLQKLQKLELIDMGAELVRRIGSRDEDSHDYVRVSKIKSIIIRSRCGKDGANEKTYQYMSSISSSIQATNIVRNHDFSEGLKRWESNCCTATVKDEDDQPDSRHAVVSNGTGERQGVEQDITDRISFGSLYKVSAFVRVLCAAHETPNVEASLRLEYQEQKIEHVPVISTSVSNGTWQELKGTIILSTRPNSVIFCLNAPSPGVELGIKSVVIEESEIILNPRFEQNLNNWSGRGCEIFESESMGYNGYITPFSGRSFACTRNRNEDWHGIDQDITGRVSRKLAYEVTAVARIFSSSNVTKSDVIATLYVKTTDNREEYIEIAKVEATDAEWKRLQGRFFINGEPSRVVVYIEGPPREIDILLDSLVVKHAKNTHPSPGPVIQNPAFGENIIENSDPKEREINPWFGLGDCILSVENGSQCDLPPLARGALAPYKDGNKSLSGRFLKSTNRSKDWMGPAQMITDKLKLFLTYQVSAWVQIGYGAKGSQTVSIKLEVVNQGEDAKDKLWVNGGEVEVTDEKKWYEIAGSFRLEKQPARVMIYVFGPDPGIDLKVCGLHVFPVQPATRFEELKFQTDKNRKRDVVLTLSRANSGNSPITAVRVRQTQNSFPFGSCLYRSNMDNEDFRKFFLENFNWAVFANELTWCETEQKRGKSNYKDADEMLQFCQSNNIHVRGHCIFWDSIDPAWVSPLGKRQLRKALKKRLKGFIAHCKGKLKHYEVVNEMLNGSRYTDELGEKSIVKLFERAKKLDPNACLFMNEESIDNGSSIQSCPEKYVKLVQNLKNQGAPIEGVGIQGQNNSPVGVIIRSALDKLEELKLPVWYTELKVSSADEHVRADDLEVMIREAYAHPAVGGIMLWGFWEMCMGENGENISHLINAEGEPNEAGKRFLALKKEFLSNEEGNVDEQGTFKFRGFPGTYSIEVDTASGTFSSTFDFEKGDDPVNLTVSI